MLEFGNNAVDHILQISTCKLRAVYLILLSCLVAERFIQYRGVLRKITVYPILWGDKCSHGNVEMLLAYYLRVVYELRIVHLLKSIIWKILN